MAFGGFARTRGSDSSSETVFDPSSEYVTYTTHWGKDGDCGARGRNAMVDSDLCSDSEMLVSEYEHAFVSWDDPVAEVDGCKYYAYAIYSCAIPDLGDYTSGCNNEPLQGWGWGPGVIKTGTEGSGTRCVSDFLVSGSTVTGYEDFEACAAYAAAADSCRAYAEAYGGGYFEYDSQTGDCGCCVSDSYTEADRTWEFGHYKFAETTVESGVEADGSPRVYVGLYDDSSCGRASSLEVAEFEDIDKALCMSEGGLEGTSYFCLQCSETGYLWVGSFVERPSTDAFGRVDFAKAVAHRLVDPTDQCGAECHVRPMADDDPTRSARLAWHASGVTRRAADVVPFNMNFWRSKP